VTKTLNAGWRECAAVVLGGMLGTGLRLALDLALPHPVDGFPWSTLLINVIGSLLLGLLVGTVWRRPTSASWLKAGLGVGALGAFTTFSAVMVSAVAMSASGQWMLAAGYLVASVVLGIGAAALGLRAGRPGTAIGVDE
jgi:CrcB protein